jgi:hypothetical protein
MRKIETLTDQERRHLVHIYASLRDHIKDEVRYDREPEFPLLDFEVEQCIRAEIYEQLTRLMVGVHAEEATRVQRVIDDYVAAYVAGIPH